MPTSKTIRHFLHYASCGAMAFIVDYSTFLLLYYRLHQPLVVANSAGFIIGLTISFLLNRYWVFRPRDQSTANQFALFAGLAAGNLILTNLVLLVLNHAGIKPAIGKLFVQSMVILWNYAIMRKYIFVHKKPGVSLEN